MTLDDVKTAYDLRQSLLNRRTTLHEIGLRGCGIKFRTTEINSPETIMTQDESVLPVILAALRECLITDIRRLETELDSVGVTAKLELIVEP